MNMHKSHMEHCARDVHMLCIWDVMCMHCRYLDMIVTEGVRDTFRKRSKVMSTIRHMLEQQDYLEIETPVLESVAGLSSVDRLHLLDLHACSWDLMEVIICFLGTSNALPAKVLLTVSCTVNSPSAAFCILPVHLISGELCLMMYCPVHLHLDGSAFTPFHTLATFRANSQY